MMESTYQDEPGFPAEDYHPQKLPKWELLLLQQQQGRSYHRSCTIYYVSGLMKLALHVKIISFVEGTALKVKRE